MNLNSNYVISLDGIDLSYMSTYTNRGYNHVVPIWTKDNLDLRNNQYFKFEIKNADGFEETNETTNFELIMCHICNLNVPNIFIKEHNLSAKHQTFMKIADITLNRIKNAMNNVQVFNNKQRKSNVHFCPSCATVVNVKDKHKHESSISHRNSVNIEKLLQHFLDLFSNNDNFNYDYVKSEIQSTNENTENETDKGIYSEHLNLNNKTDLNKTDNNNNQNDKTNIKDTPLQENCNTDITNNLEKFVDELINTHKLEMKIKIIDDQNLEIITCEGSCVNISENNFNGFKELGFYLQCLLCKHIIKATDKKDHLYSKLHMERVSFSFQDPHCLRQIDNSWGHCALCNQNIENSETHILCNENHDSLLKIALIGDSNSLNKFTSNCFKIKNKGLPDIIDERTDIFNIDTNTDSDDNKKYLTLQTNKIPVMTSNNINETVRTDIVIDNVDDNLSKVKSEDASFKKDLFLDEVENVKYKDLITNTSSEADDAKNNTRLKTDIMHTNNNSSKILNTDSISKKNENNLPKNLSLNFCSENDNCNSKILNTAIVLDGDVDHDVNNYNLEHTNNIFNDNLEFNVICEGETECKEVKGTVIDDISNLTKTDMNQSLDYCNACETNLSDIDINLHINNKIHIINEKIKNLDIHYLMEVSNINELRCKVCHIVITNMSTAVTNHLENVNHITNYNNLLAENCIRSLSNGTFYCDLCKLHFTKIYEMLHIEESLHKQNKIEFETYGTKVTKIKETDPLEYHYCNICKMNILNNKTSILIHNLGADHIQNEDRLNKNKQSQDTSTSFNIHHHFISKDNHLYCLVCNIEVLKRESYMQEHIQANDHLTQYSNILILNHIYNKDGKFNCKICAIDDLKNELIHCKSQGHVKALNFLKKVNSTNTIVKPNPKKSCINISSNSNVENKNLPSNLLQKVHNSMELMCKVCQVYLPDKYENIITHLRGSKHKRKYEDYKNESLENRTEFDMKYLHYQMRHENKNLHCVICKEKVIVDEKAMCDHIKSHNHNINYNIFLEKNQLHEEFDKFYCKACLEYVNYGHELIHSKNKSHIASLISLNIDNIETIENLNPSINDVHNEIAVMRQMINEIRSLIQNFFGTSS